ncbi:hypothetical protein GCK32_015895, partial [Trichostrongylus colubriformis]
MRGFFYLILVIIVECTTTGKKIKVPNSDPTLQDLIYKSAVPASNDNIRDKVWWVPSTNNYE